MQSLMSVIIEYLDVLVITGGILFFIVFVRTMRGSGRQRVIMMACQWGDTAEVRELLREVPHLAKASDRNGFTPLHVAAMWGHEDIVNMLIDFGADPNAANRAGMTPLHCAAMGGHSTVVQMLLMRLAKVNAADVQGNTPLYFAVWDGHLNIVQTLIASGATINHTNARGETALDRARKQPHPEVVEALIEAGAGTAEHSGNTVDLPTAHSG